MNIAELDVAVGGRQASAPFEEMIEKERIESVEVSIARGSVKENVVATKNDVEEVLLPAMREKNVTPEEEHVSTSLAPVKLKAVMTMVVEGAQALDIEDVSSSVVVKSDEPTPEEE